MMRNYIRGFMFLVLIWPFWVVAAEQIGHSPLLLAKLGDQATTFKEGVHYELLSDPQPTEVPPGKIEVRELFSYGCPHCYRLEQPLEHWLKNKPDDVAFIAMPGILSPSWTIYGKVFYTLEALGQLDTMHGRVFEAMHEQHRRLATEDAFARFFESQGIDADKFREAMNSLAVITKTNHAAELTKSYDVSGVPALIVNGRYRVLNSGATSYEELFSVVDFLVDKERARLAAKS